VRGEREKKKYNKTDILRVRIKRKKKLLLKKKWNCESSIYFRRFIFFGVQIAQGFQKCTYFVV
jgi:hypothetical protein